MTDTEEALSAVVDAELRAWVPGASQRLIRRAADRMGLVVPMTGAAVQCMTGKHCRTSDWVAGIYVLRCINCDFLTRY